MLNYIWMGLIVVSILVGIGYDLHDQAADTYRNGKQIEIIFTPDGAARGADQSGTVRIRADRFAALYGVSLPDSAFIIHQAVLHSKSGSIAITLNDQTPRIWVEMADAAGTKGILNATVASVLAGPAPGIEKLMIVPTPVSFIKMRKITQAAVDYSGTAVTIAIGLIGIMALWLGIMKIAELAGLLSLLTKILSPLTRRLFPDVPADHPAVGAMIMNIAANMLGLSNAATPLGLKAMEELEKLNPKKGTATNAMVIFLAINTGGLTLIPATAMAIRASLGSGNPTLIVGTSIFGALCATIAGVGSAKLFERLPIFKRALLPDPAETPSAESKEA